MSEIGVQASSRRRRTGDPAPPKLSRGSQVTPLTQLPAASAWLRCNGCDMLFPSRAIISGSRQFLKPRRQWPFERLDGGRKALFLSCPDSEYRKSRHGTGTDRGIGITCRNGRHHGRHLQQYDEDAARETLGLVKIFQPLVMVSHAPGDPMPSLAAPKGSRANSPKIQSRKAATRGNAARSRVVTM